MSRAPGARVDAGTPRDLVVLAALAASAGASAAWSGHLWLQLLELRRGGEAVCAFGGSGCGVLWDASFAAAVHRLSGVPVAGWGLAWALAALLLPLAVLLAALRGRPAPLARVAIGWVAAGGTLAIAALAAVSLEAGELCTSCAVVYALVAVYALAAFAFLARPPASAARGAALALAVVAGAYALMLLPGLRTPRAGEAAAALASAGGRGERGDHELEDYLASLSPPMRQGLAASLAAYRAAPPLPEEEPRALLGEPAAPVRITEFTDIRCSHCATLDQTLETLWSKAPAGSFSVDSRHFPLDGRCNPRLAPRPGEPVSCTAALARICFESADPEARRAYAGRLFEHQEELEVEDVFALAAPEIDEAELRACIERPETARALADDLDYAWRYDPKGTPLVLIDGREGTPFGPFLYALVLAGGDAEHPAFAALGAR